MLALCLHGLLPPVAAAATLDVPADYPSIQRAIEAAADGDVVLVAPGTYYENVRIRGKGLVLASWFYSTGDPSYISRTIIDGGNRRHTIVVDTDAEGTEINGLRIQNGHDGLYVLARSFILNNHIVNNSDGVDFEGGGGLCANNLFACNLDDGIDLDGPAAVQITNNTIRDNRDDGIEIRFHPYSGATLHIDIVANLIGDNGEDGIQLIDYPDLSDRVVRIEHNLLVGNQMAALGCMGDGKTVENYEGSAIPERVYLTNNTFFGNRYGVVGGANLIALNNVFMNTKRIALKRLTGNSIAAFNLFWNNGTDYIDSNVDWSDSLFQDPWVTPDYRLMPGSPALNNGTSNFVWQGETVLDLPATSFSESAPDIGAREHVVPPGGGDLEIGFEHSDGVRCQSAKEPDCFIASVAYGSFVEPRLDTLRNFRDRYLMTNSFGRRAVALYYAHSYRLANSGHQNKVLKLFWRLTIFVLILGIDGLSRLNLLHAFVTVAVLLALRAGATNKVIVYDR